MKKLEAMRAHQGSCQPLRMRAGSKLCNGYGIAFFAARKAEAVNGEYNKLYASAN